MRRRELLKLLGLGSLAVGCPPGEGGLPDDGRNPVPDEDWPGGGAGDEARFPLGVQSGDPLPDGLLLWTRHLGGGTLAVQVAVWDGGWKVDRTVPVEADADGFVHAEVSGLPADTAIAFQFVAEDGTRSEVGHSRTALSEDAWTVLRFGATSCANPEHVDFPSLARAMERARLDLWLWAGDQVYLDGLEGLAGFRDAYAANWRSSGFRSVLPRVPGLFAWDDHEVANDWTYDVEGNAELAALGLRAFLEHTPHRPLDHQWRSFRYGRTAEIFVLDCRGERDGQRYVSQAQVDWLKRSIRASRATWKVVLNSVPITDLPALYEVPNVIGDRWEGFAEQRAELLGALEGVTGVLFVSGDFHHPALCRVDPDSPIFEAFTGPCGSNRNPIGPLLADGAQYLWSDAAWSSSVFEVHASGLGRVVFVGEEDETWCECFFDDRGHVLSLEHTPSGYGLGAEDR